MKFQPLCGYCCSSLTPNAVLTSCQHILCVDCQRIQEGTCPLCKKGCQTISFNHPSFPAKLKELMVLDTTAAFQKAMEASQFQLQQQATTIQRFREILQRSAEQTNALKRKNAELQTKYDEACQDVKRLKGMVDTMQNSQMDAHASQAMKPRMGSGQIITSPVVGPRIQSGVDPRTVVRNRLLGAANLHTGASVAVERCHTPRTPLAMISPPSICVDSPRSIMSAGSSAAPLPLPRSSPASSQISERFNRPFTPSERCRELLGPRSHLLTRSPLAPLLSSTPASASQMSKADAIASQRCA